MYYFIVNEHSRSGNHGSVWGKVSHILEATKIKYKVRNTMYKGHATEIASQICELPDDDKRIVVVGGDGTINEVINGITDFENVSLSVIPTGSGNDFARGLELPKSPEEGLRNILRCKKAVRMDLGKVYCPENGKERLFAISCGMGMDALVCKKTNESTEKKLLNALHIGSLSYLVLTVESLFTMSTEKATVTVDDGKKHKRFERLIFLAAMNFKAEGGGVPMSPGASAFDGELTVCTGSGIPKWLAFFLLPFLVISKHEKIKAFDFVNGKKLDVRVKAPVDLHTDGEYLGAYKRAVIECLPKKLKIRK